MTRRRFVLGLPIIALIGCGGGGGDGETDDPVADGGAPPPSQSAGRYRVTISGAQIESYVSPLGAATITRAALLLDNEVVADRSFNPATSAGFFGTFMELPRDAGRHVVEFRILGQTVTSSDYAINPQGFIFISDTESTFTKIITLSQANFVPYSATLRTGEGIRVQFDIP